MAECWTAAICAEPGMTATHEGPGKEGKSKAFSSFLSAQLDLQHHLNIFPILTLTLPGKRRMVISPMFFATS